MLRPGLHVVAPRDRAEGRKEGKRATLDGVGPPPPPQHRVHIPIRASPTRKRTKSVPLPLQERPEKDVAVEPSCGSFIFHRLGLCNWSHTLDNHQHQKTVPVTRYYVARLPSFRPSERFLRGIHP